MGAYKGERPVTQQNDEDSTSEFGGLAEHGSAPVCDAGQVETRAFTPMPFCEWRQEINGIAFSRQGVFVDRGRAKIPMGGVAN